MEKRYVGSVPGRVLFFNLEEYGQGDHCCAEMNIHIHEKERVVKYFVETREYGIQASEYIVQMLKFCPWCGKQLPPSLREKFFDVLELEYEIITNAGDYKDRPDIPEEFRSDKWWKKRNL